MMFQHSLYQVIFIQAAVIFETGPGCSQHVAVPVSRTEIVHFMPTVMSEMYTCFEWAIAIAWHV